ncbi:hypothetical protein V2O64_07365 [Verrucomicrobiaceae bacterium 227]
MKLLMIALSCLGSTFVLADEYRYNLMATTGLQEGVFDQKGKKTTIVFSKESNAEARFILTKILEVGGINGTKSAEQWRGAPYEQAIILKGKLDPTVVRTSSAPNTAQAEDYQEFCLDEVMIRFPIIRHRPGKVFDTAYLETHFSFDTLFPDGLMFGSEKVDFEKHTAKSKPQK